ncbi:MAG: Gfo/Idh/MocA family oxidoreductase [Planctomycetota bacterium]|nr:Gfo/Idh/MocA family oxidoreductase [Planctomycetota bacterium]
MTSIGIIGAGMIGNVHAETAMRVETSIACVFDSNEEKRSAFAEKFGCEEETTVESLLSRDDIDGVVIAVPNFQHATLAIQALEAGKHVLLEKPMALSIEECDKILKARDTSGKVLQLGFVCRYSPAAMKAKTMIDDGAIGNIVSIQATLLRQRGIPGLGGWFTTKALSGGGCLIDIGVHLIDLVMHMTSMNTPKRVIGRCSQAFTMANYAYDEMWSDPVENGTFDVEDRIRASITFETGIVFDLNVSWATHIPEQTIADGLLIEGKNGALIVDLWSDEMIHAYSVDGKPHSETIKVDLEDAWNDAFDGEHRAFSSSVKNGVISADAGTGEDGKRVQEIVEAIYKSDDAQKEMTI